QQGDVALLEIGIARRLADAVDGRGTAHFAAGSMGGGEERLRVASSTHHVSGITHRARDDSQNTSACGSGSFAVNDSLTAAPHGLAPGKIVKILHRRNLSHTSRTGDQRVDDRVIGGGEASS